MRVHASPSTAASETLHGTPGDDVICGLGGDDVIYGLGGNDIIIGGTGNDTLHGGEGNDALHGGPNDDVLWGGEGDDTLEGNRGNDSLYGAEAYASASLLIGVLLFEAAMLTMTARRGTTPGKSLLGIQVVAHSDSLPPGATRAILRWAVPLVPLAPLVDAFIRDIPELTNYEQAPALSGRVWWVWVALGLVAARPCACGVGPRPPRLARQSLRHRRGQSAATCRDSITQPRSSREPPTPSWSKRRDRADAPQGLSNTCSLSRSSGAACRLGEPVTPAPAPSARPPPYARASAARDDSHPGGLGDDILYGGGTGHLDGRPGTDTCARGETTAQCEDHSRAP